MKVQKMNLSNLKGKLSRAEMKTIMAGNAPEGGCKALGTACTSNADCGGANNYCYCRIGGYGCM